MKDGGRSSNRNELNGGRFIERASIYLGPSQERTLDGFQDDSGVAHHWHRVDEVVLALLEAETILLV